MKMKNKKQEQEKKKKAHKQRLIANKRRKDPSLERKVPQKIKKEEILIVCEGANTEPSYFEQFKLSTASIKVLGDGFNTLSLVNQAYKIHQKDKSEGKNYDQVWCVFDKDEFENQAFNQATITAHSYGFNVAYSNQAFEYWFILHFEDHQGGAMDRKDYDAKINSYLNKYNVHYDGKKSKRVSTGMFELMLALDEKTNISRQTLAIDRAIKVLNFHKESGAPPSKSESSTSVFELVKELNKFK